MNKLLNCLIICTIFLGISKPAKAMPIQFFGEDLGANSSFVPNGNAVDAQNAFLSKLSDTSTEDFESSTLGVSSHRLSFTGSAGTIGGVLRSNPGSFVSNGMSGIFPTSGSQVWQSNSRFSIEFETPIVALGFFVEDVEVNPLTLQLDLVGGGTKDILIDSTVRAPNGGLTYFGFIDKDQPFTRVTFLEPTRGDGYGFDDITVAEQVQSVPEPSTILGTFMALGFGALLKKKGAKKDN
ncbi:MAG: PEP-CTERM sorting domain-containing protein [Okeania sp. SIO3I5]|uniref:PEP-CTERM sorting domain-containing protein n=1 Tax=Okeania sp. SIO3I5 TaxID=2607805 RepID=UPI0013B9B1A8|nr:PEP-CTERM sorting domain-containing protein [Okeania sp. SIO3I5]NEQ39423.1 PEP-CTERM sorting domain-containing protein [Okeania sp. SIO3I5]